MFLDVLGTLIAFLTLIALLSVFVTTIVQLVQATLRLRARNLQMCLAGLVMKAQKTDPDFGVKRLTGETLKAKELAAKILNSPDVSPISQVSDPTSFWHYYISAPKVSWVEPAELEEAIKDKDFGLNDDQQATLVADFKTYTPHLRRRFQFICKIYTVAISFIVAIGFQVSAPETFSRLSEQTVEQQKFASDASALLAQYQAELEADSPIDEQDAEALEEDVDKKLAELAGVGLEWWPNADFYCDGEEWQVSNMIGVLMTAVLLSLGAPFWFEQLGRVVGLRDTLARYSGEKDSEEGNETSGEKKKAGKKTTKKTSKKKSS